MKKHKQADKVPNVLRISAPVSKDKHLFRPVSLRVPLAVLPVVVCFYN